MPGSLPEAIAARWHDAAGPAQAATLARLDAPARLESLTGLVLLASCLRELGLEISLATIQRPHRGKPGWRHGPEFSISHAAGRAGCAVAPEGVAVGIDLERHHAATVQMLHRVMSTTEHEQVRSGAIDATGLWVCKEAVLKAAGAGIEQVAQVRIDGDVGHHAGRRYWLRRVDLGAGILLGVAASVRPDELLIREPDVRALFDTAAVP